MTSLNMQHTFTPFLIRALSKTEEEGEEEKKKKRQSQKGERKEGNMKEKEGSVALISWQFGTGPDLPGKATDVSEPVRDA